MLLKFVGGLAALVLLLVAVAFFLRRGYRVERAIVIRAAGTRAPPAQITAGSGGRSAAMCAMIRSLAIW